jgi:transposase
MKRHALSEDQWQRLEMLLPPEKLRVGRPATTTNRQVVEAVLWLAKTGVPWRDLPAHFGAWQTIYSRFRRWSLRGVWTNLLPALADPDTESYILDSTIVRVHQHGTGGKGGRRRKVSADREEA